MRMPSKPPILISGQVSLSHFEKLLKFGTDIRGRKVIDAMREHLVCGTQKTQACRLFGATPSHFSDSLRRFQNAAEAALDLFAEDFYLTRLSVKDETQETPETPESSEAPQPAI